MINEPFKHKRSHKLSKVVNIMMVLIDYFINVKNSRAQKTFYYNIYKQHYEIKLEEKRESL